MSVLVPILAMAASVFTLRLSGFLFANVAIPVAWERALGFVPIATLTALVTASLVSRPSEVPIRLVAAVVGGLAVYRTRRAWVCILVGLAIYEVLRLR